MKSFGFDYEVTYLGIYYKILGILIFILRKMGFLVRGENFFGYLYVEERTSNELARRIAR
jgi:hypothetical protein